MKFKIDENCPKVLKKVLNDFGVDDVEDVYQEGLNGKSDHVLISKCKSENRILLTMDMDFSHNLIHSLNSLYGVIILHLYRKSVDKIVLLLKKFLSKISIDSLEGKVFVVDEEYIRIRDEY